MNESEKNDDSKGGARKKEDNNLTMVPKLLNM